jgi:undecaprenyl-diphosphatase
VDYTLFKAVNGFAVQHDLFEDVMKFFANDGQYLFAVLLAGLFLAAGRRRTLAGRRGVAGAGFSALLALGIAQIIASAVDRARPFEAHAQTAQHHLFIAPSTDPSFPSDHATASFAIAVSIWLRHRVAGTIALALAFLVSLGRVAVGTHYPGDVVGGAILGAACALLLWLPVFRRPIHALADWAGSVYDRLLAGASRRSRPAD